MSSFLFSCISFKCVLLLALVSEFNCFLRTRCSMEMWCPDDIGRDSWDWVGPPAWERACFNSPEWGGGSSPVKTDPLQIVLLLLLRFLLHLHIARNVSTSSSDSVFTKQKPIATMGMSGGGPSSLRWGQSRANPFTQCEHQAQTGKWLTECVNIVLCGFVWQSSCPWHICVAHSSCWWRIIISRILTLQWTQLRQRCRTDVIHTIRFVQMYHSTILAQRVSLLISHHNSKPYAKKTTHSQAWTADRKQLEHGFHNDCHTVHVNHFKCHFQRTLRCNRCSCGSEKSSSSGRNRFCFARPRMACSSRIHQKTRCCSTVPDSDLPQPQSSSSGIDRLCTSSNAHLLHHWNLHCLILSSWCIHVPSDQPHHSYSKHLSSWRHHPWVLCLSLAPFFPFPLPLLPTVLR